MRLSAIIDTQGGIPNMLWESISSEKVAAIEGSVFWKS